MYSEMFLENFEALIANADGVTRMRELILQLAVRGKLVPQSSQDEDATTILEAIQGMASPSVKRRWERFGDGQSLFSTPSNWVWSSIGRVSIDWGQKVPDSDFCYIDVGGIDNSVGRVADLENFVSPDDAPSRARKIVKPGTVIYSTVRPYLRNIAIVPDNFTAEPIASTAFAIVAPLAEILPEFVFYYLRSPDFNAHVENQMLGAAYPAINDAKFFASPIPVPPLKEQRRIVGKVNALISLCDQLQIHLDKDVKLRRELANSLAGKILDIASDGDDPSPIGSGGAKPSQEKRGRPKRWSTSPPAVGAASSTSIIAAPVDTKFQEAALVGAIVKSFFADGGEPIGNFRLQKAVYFARRHNADPSATSDFLKKAAGPYNPSMKYSGGIAIAKAKNYITEARGRYGFGHIPGATIAELEPAVERYGYGASATWVNQHFKFKKNEEWELLATVDYAMLQLRDATPADILAYVANDPEWRPKIEKLGLTEFKIESAMLEIRALFPNSNGSA